MMLAQARVLDRGQSIQPIVRLTRCRRTQLNNDCVPEGCEPHPCGVTLQVSLISFPRQNDLLRFPLRLLWYCLGTLLALAQKVDVGERGRRSGNTGSGCSPKQGRLRCRAQAGRTASASPREQQRTLHIVPRAFTDFGYAMNYGPVQRKDLCLGVTRPYLSPKRQEDSSKSVPHRRVLLTLGTSFGDTSCRSVATLRSWITLSLAWFRTSRSDKRLTMEDSSLPSSKPSYPAFRAGGSGRG
ncbi:hypothetical protein C8Q76DRAFT_702885 [Earliella scabrosa]|nr:hypothetical protein C8Q76DRAFT_702885 [Earliella scabrosa]